MAGLTPGGPDQTPGRVRRRYIPVLVLLVGAVVALVMGVLVLGRAIRLGDSGQQPRADEIVTATAKDGIRAIDDPVLITASEAEAAQQMVSGEFVIGVELNGDSKAYPVNILSFHEIVNDSVGGVPIAVTFCPLCFTGFVYDRRVDDEELTFGVSGKLIMNNLVMYDRQTDTLWSQILGEAVEGELAGLRLDQLPHTQTSWSAWRRQHPDTLVMAKDGPYFNDPHDFYYSTEAKGVLGETHHDDRLPPKDLVLGYIFGGRAKAYPFRELLQTPVVNDTFEGHELLVVFERRSKTGRIFDRTVGDHTLNFELADLAEGDVIIRDVETETTWSGLSGEALDGPLAGESLQPLPSFYAFWFTWTDFFIEAELYEG